MRTGIVCGPAICPLSSAVLAENSVNKSGEKNQTHVAKAVDKMFKQWPNQ